ncbi:MAG: asparagine synthase (glutamine-hydrolyzing), partial [Candidatus Edwardsbacteria bacterium]|nr:asparagine synthase (glutamine-hydrolyzing) [Candidatus Edwardsbacteria bacterium]
LVDVIDGMFAFALWDPYKKRLLLARDRMGIKPLYYHDDGRRIVFASSLTALLADRSIDRAVSLPALNDYLALRYVPAPDTAITGVQKLEPGHTLVVSKGGVEKNQYWDIPLRLLKLSEREARELVSQQLRRSIESHLMSDVPVAAFLSGGIDSSIVVGAMVKAGARPKTFSAGFDFDDEFDELRYAKLVADHWDLENYQVRVGPVDVINHLPEIVRALEEPIADPAAIPGYFLSRLASEHVKVALTGEGADETFAGYKRYQWAARRQGWFRLLSSLGKAPRLIVEAQGFDFYRHRTAVFLTEPDAEAAYLENVSLFTRRERQELSGPDLSCHLQQSPYPERPAQAFSAAGDLTLMERLQYTDSKYWLADDLLIKMDKISMAHSLEARVPFLDHRLVDLAWQVPVSLKYRKETSKYLLREAGREFLPPEIFDRPKHGFDLPLARWLRGDLGEFARERIMDSRWYVNGLLRRATLERHIAEHRAGKKDRSFQIFALLCWALWEHEVLG